MSAIFHSVLLIDSKEAVSPGHLSGGASLHGTFPPLLNLASFVRAGLW